MIFTKISMTMNEHTYELFENIFNDVQTEGKGGKILLNITTKKL